MGDAGTGKSAIINTIREYIFSHTVEAAASTNIIATNIIRERDNLKNVLYWINVGIDDWTMKQTIKRQLSRLMVVSIEQLLGKNEPPITYYRWDKYDRYWSMDMYLMLQHRRHILLCLWWWLPQNGKY